MKSRIITGAAMAALVLPMSFALSMPSASAASGSVDYSCQFSSSVTRSGDVGVRVDLVTPTSVQAGQAVTLAGTVTVTIPSSLRKEMSLVARNATLSSPTMSMVVAVGTNTVNVPISLGSKRQSVRYNKTLAFTYDFALSDIDVPSGAGGSLDVSLPGNGYTNNTVRTSPAKVAFAGRLVLSGVGISRNLACALPASSNPRIASVPVAKPAETPTPEPGGSGDNGGESGSETDSGNGPGTGGDTGDTGGVGGPSNGIPGSAGTPQFPGFPGAAPGSGGLPNSVFDPPAPSAPGMNSVLPGVALTPGPDSLLPVGPDGESPVPLPPGAAGEERAETTDIAYAGLPPQTGGDAASLPTQIVVGVIALIVLGGLGIAVPARLHLMRIREEVA